ncbi:MAG: hypothetical protein GQ582_01000, partial [Methyloprofundus sp.]|nr:hypothetical protein [Methyloprofundus sp.]
MTNLSFANSLYKRFLDHDATDGQRQTLSKEIADKKQADSSYDAFAASADFVANNFATQHSGDIKQHIQDYYAHFSETPKLTELSRWANQDADLTRTELNELKGFLVYSGYAEQLHTYADSKGQTLKISSASDISSPENETLDYTLKAQGVDSKYIKYTLNHSEDLKDDSRLFILDEKTGELNFKKLPDFEVKSTYNLTLFATDTQTSYDTFIDLTINIGDIEAAFDISSSDNLTLDDLKDEEGKDGEEENEAPIFSSDVVASADENSTDVFYAALAFDANEDFLTYTLGNTEDKDNRFFSINSLTGELAFIEAQDFEAGKSTYLVDVGVFDGHSEKPILQEVNVTLNDVNEIPSFNFNTDVFAYKNQSGSFFVVSALDPEGNPLTYSLGNIDEKDNRFFTIDPETGALSIRDQEAFRNEDINRIYVIDISVTDGIITEPITQEISITIADFFDPVLQLTAADGGGTLSVLEGEIAAYQVVVSRGAIKAGDTVSFTLDAVNGTDEFGAVNPDDFSNFIDLGTASYTYSHTFDTEVAAGTGIFNFSLATQEDDLLEPTEAFSIELNNATKIEAVSEDAETGGTGVSNLEVLGSPLVTQIENVREPNLTLMRLNDSDELGIREDNSAEYKIVLSKGNIRKGETLTFQLDASGKEGELGTATYAKDFSAFTNTDLNDFADFKDLGEAKYLYTKTFTQDVFTGEGIFNFSTQVLKDKDIEDPEDFSLTLHSALINADAAQGGLEVTSDGSPLFTEIIDVIHAFQFSLQGAETVKEGDSELQTAQYDIYLHRSNIPANTEVQLQLGSASGDNPEAEAEFNALKLVDFSALSGAHYNAELGILTLTGPLKTSDFTPVASLSLDITDDIEEEKGEEFSISIQDGKFNRLNLGTTNPLALDHENFVTKLITTIEANDKDIVAPVITTGQSKNFTKEGFTTVDRELLKVDATDETKDNLGDKETGIQSYQIESVSLRGVKNGEFSELLSVEQADIADMFSISDIGRISLIAGAIDPEVIFDALDENASFFSMTLAVTASDGAAQQIEGEPDIEANTSELVDIVFKVYQTGFVFTPFVDELTSYFEEDSGIAYDETFVALESADVDSVKDTLDGKGGEDTLEMTVANGEALNFPDILLNIEKLELKGGVVSMPTLANETVDISGYDFDSVLLSSFKLNNSLLKLGSNSSNETPLLTLNNIQNVDTDSLLTIDNDQRSLILALGKSLVTDEIPAPEPDPAVNLNVKVAATSLSHLTLNSLDSSVNVHRLNLDYSASTLSEILVKGDHALVLEDYISREESTEAVLAVSANSLSFDATVNTAGVSSELSFTEYNVNFKGSTGNDSFRLTDQDRMDGGGGVDTAKFYTPVASDNLSDVDLAGVENIEIIASVDSETANTFDFSVQTEALAINVSNQSNSSDEDLSIIAGSGDDSLQANKQVTFTGNGGGDTFSVYPADREQTNTNFNVYFSDKDRKYMITDFSVSENDMISVADTETGVKKLTNPHSVQLISATTGGDETFIANSGLVIIDSQDSRAKSLSTVDVATYLNNLGRIVEGGEEDQLRFANNDSSFYLLVASDGQEGEAGDVGLFAVDAREFIDKDDPDIEDVNFVIEKTELKLITTLQGIDSTSELKQSFKEFTYNSNDRSPVFELMPFDDSAVLEGGQANYKIMLNSGVIEDGDQLTFDLKFPEDFRGSVNKAVQGIDFSDFIPGSFASDVASVSPSDSETDLSQLAKLELKFNADVAAGENIFNFSLNAEEDNLFDEDESFLLDFENTVVTDLLVSDEIKGVITTAIISEALITDIENVRNPILSLVAQLGPVGEIDPNVSLIQEGDEPAKLTVKEGSTITYKLVLTSGNIQPGETLTFDLDFKDGTGDLGALNPDDFSNDIQFLDAEIPLFYDPKIYSDSSTYSLLPSPEEVDLETSDNPSYSYSYHLPVEQEQVEAGSDILAFSLETVYDQNKENTEAFTVEVSAGELNILEGQVDGSDIFISDVGSDNSPLKTHIANKLNDYIFDLTTGTDTFVGEEMNDIFIADNSDIEGIPNQVSATADTLDGGAERGLRDDEIDEEKDAGDTFEMIVGSGGVILPSTILNIENIYIKGNGNTFSQNINLSSDTTLNKLSLSELTWAGEEGTLTDLTVSASTVEIILDAMTVPVLQIQQEVEIVVPIIEDPSTADKRLDFTVQGASQINKLELTASELEILDLTIDEATQVQGLALNTHQLKTLDFRFSSTAQSEIVLSYTDTTLSEINFYATETLSLVDDSAVLQDIPAELLGLKFNAEDSSASVNSDLLFTQYAVNFTGSAQDDAFRLTEVDRMDGGGGTDTAKFDTSVGSAELADENLLNVEKIEISSAGSAGGETKFDFSVQTENLEFTLANQSLETALNNLVLVAGEGNDTLQSNYQATLTGGAGSDTFIIGFSNVKGLGNYTITDFVVDKDVIRSGRDAESTTTTAANITNIAAAQLISNTNINNVLEGSVGFAETFTANSGLVLIDNTKDNVGTSESLSTADVASYLADIGTGDDADNVIFENNNSVMYLVVSNGADSGLYRADAAAALLEGEEADRKIDADELSLITTFTGISDAASLAGSFADFTLQNEDRNPVVTLVATDENGDNIDPLTVVEGDEAVYKVILSSGAIKVGESISFTLDAVNGVGAFSATSPDDFAQFVRLEGASYTHTYTHTDRNDVAIGKDFLSFNLTAKDDNDFEPTEAFSIELNTANITGNSVEGTLSAGVSGSPLTTEIENRRHPELTLRAVVEEEGADTSELTVIEGDIASYEIVLTSGNIQEGETLSFNLETLIGTATNDDFSSFSDFSNGFISFDMETQSYIYTHTFTEEKKAVTEEEKLAEIGIEDVQLLSFSIATTEDSEFEAIEDFAIALNVAEVTGGSLTAPLAVAVSQSPFITKIDNSRHPTLTLSAVDGSDSLVVAEGDIAEYKVVLSSGNIQADETLSFTLDALNGLGEFDALNPEDFSDFINLDTATYTYTHTFTEEAVKNHELLRFSLTAAVDDLFEATESFSIELKDASVTDIESVGITETLFTTNIENVRHPELTLSAINNGAVIEGNTAKYEVVLTSGTIQPGETLSFSLETLFNTLEFTADADDFSTFSEVSNFFDLETATYSHTFTVEEGAVATGDQLLSFNIDTILDSVVEEDEDFSIALTDANIDTNVELTTVELTTQGSPLTTTISNRNTPSLALVPESAILDENGVWNITKLVLTEGDIARYKVVLTGGVIRENETVSFKLDALSSVGDVVNSSDFLNFDFSDASYASYIYEQKFTQEEGIAYKLFSFNLATKLNDDANEGVEAFDILLSDASLKNASGKDIAGIAIDGNPLTTEINNRTIPALKLVAGTNGTAVDEGGTAHYSIELNSGKIQAGETLSFSLAVVSGSATVSDDFADTIIFSTSALGSVSFNGSNTYTYLFNQDVETANTRIFDFSLATTLDFVEGEGDEDFSIDLTNTLLNSGALSEELTVSTSAGSSLTTIISNREVPVLALLAGINGGIVDEGGTAHYSIELNSGKIQAGETLSFSLATSGTGATPA